MRLQRVRHDWASKRSLRWDVPGSPVVTTLPFHCSGGGFDPSWGKFCPYAPRHGQNETKGKLVLGFQWVGGAYDLFSFGASLTRMLQKHSTEDTAIHCTERWLNLKKNCKKKKIALETQKTFTLKNKIIETDIKCTLYVFTHPAPFPSELQRKPTVISIGYILPVYFFYPFEVRFFFFSFF